MSKRTKLLGAACGFAAAALMAGPASAAPLMSMTAVFGTQFERVNTSGWDYNGASLGGQFAGPLADLANMNFQAGAQYSHLWASGFSTEEWRFNGDLFWAGDMSRFGIALVYDTANTSGYTGGGGVFGEYYFGNITIGANGGYISQGGQNQGGDGNYVGVNGTFYPIPDLGVTAGWAWSQVNVGGSLCGGPMNCGVTGFRQNTWGIEGEFGLPAEFLGGAPSVYAGFAYNQFSGTGGWSDHDTVWHVGVRFYTGGGSLEDKHRNGALRPWATGTH